MMSYGKTCLSLTQRRNRENAFKDWNYSDVLTCVEANKAEAEGVPGTRIVSVQTLEMKMAIPLWSDPH